MIYKKALIFSLLILTACTNTPNLTINESIPSSTYSGRGTNAGPMLVGALGATGLAVGLAIDQGIAKDFDRKIEQYKSVYLHNISKKLSKNHANTTHISLERIKFTAVKRNDNLVNATVTFKLAEKSSYSNIELALKKIDFEALKSTPIFWEELLKVNLLCKNEVLSEE